MPLDAGSIARSVSEETGLSFQASGGRQSSGERLIELTLVGHHPAETFKIRIAVGWRRIDISFHPGDFSSELLESMRASDGGGRLLFVAVLEKCVLDGATVDLTIDSERQDFHWDGIWNKPWRNFSLELRRGMLALNSGDDAADAQVIGIWANRLAAAVTALLPLEGSEEVQEQPDVVGYPEGAKIAVESNRYERDRRNRAAAIAIHGYRCMACQIDLSTVYGEPAMGFIEVHHVTPVSQLGDSYHVDPRSDLVPLCPNCHGIVHRRNPPFSVEEVRTMLAKTLSSEQE